MTTSVPTVGRTQVPDALRRALAPLAVVAGLIVLWWISSIVFAGIKVVPSPAATLQAFIDDLSVYPQNIATTLSNASVGYVVGNLIAIGLGMLFVQAPAVERVLLQIAVGSFCVPMVAITPILVIVLPGEAPKQVLAGVAVFFTTLMATILGLRSSNSVSEDVVRSMGGGPWKLVTKVRLTSMLPSMFAGLQIAAPAALLGAILGEYLGAQSGLGVMLVHAQSSFEVARTWAIALVMSALSGFVFWITGVIGRRLTPWLAQEVSLVDALPAPSTVPWAKRLLVGLGSTLLATVIVLGAWWGIIVAADLNPYFAKTPWDVFRYLALDPAAAENREALLAGLAITARDAGIGYLAGTIAALVIAVITTTSKAAEQILVTPALILRSVPLVALTPLLALVFGRGLVGVAVIVALVTFFPSFVTVAKAMQGAPALACSVIESMGGSRLTVTAKVRMLYAVPALISAAKIAVPGAVAGATLAEWLATGEGLGALIVQNYAAARFSAVWADTVAVVLVSALSYAILAAIERPVRRRIGV